MFCVNFHENIVIYEMMKEPERGKLPMDRSSIEYRDYEQSLVICKVEKNSSSNSICRQL